MKKLSLVILLVFAVAASFAQGTPFTATYTFTTSSYTTSYPYSGTNPAGLSMGDMKIIGAAFGSSNNCYRAKEWPSGTVIDTGKYIGFDITANAGYAFEITKIDFGLYKSGSGPKTAEWRGSADNYATTIDSYTALHSNINNNNGVFTYKNSTSSISMTGNTMAHTTIPNDPLVGYSNLTTCGFRLYMYNSPSASGTGGLQGTFTVYGNVQSTSTNPILNVSPPSLSDFTYEENQGPSTAQTFSVSGNNLTGNISISAPTNFELSLDGNTYSGSLSLTPSGGTVTSTNINVRLVTGLAVGSYSGTVQCTSPGATAQNVGLTGSVTAPPPPGYYVDFEGDGEFTTGTAYYTGEKTLSGKNWHLSEVVIAESPLAGDWYEGTRSARLRGYGGTSMTMSEDKTNGAGTVSFQYRQYGGDTQTTWKVKYSIDGGTTWQEIPFDPPNNNTFKATATVQLFSYDLNIAGNIRLSIEEATGSGTSNKRMNIDNIAITDYYDLSNGVPKVEGNNTITLTGGNANYSSTAPGDIPNAANFTASFHKRITLLGAGPWTINVAGPVGDWAACKQGSTWQAYEMTSGTASFTINAAKNADIELLMGNGNNPTLPVELSHFSATLTAQNYVQLAWVSQSETNVLGYYIYRNDKPELSSAAQICPLIHGTNTSGAQNYSYLDTDLYEEGTYYYWLQNVDMDGSSNYHGYVSVILRIEEEGGTPSMPTVTMLEDAYPNPFNPSTMIPYQIKEGGKVRIDIYNTRGQLVRSFEEKHETAGRYQINWNGRDNSGKELSSGVYLYKMSAKDYNSTKKIVLTK